MTSAPLIPRSMTVDEFLPFVGQALDVDCAPRAVTLTLVEASASRHPGLDDRPPFILIFRSGPESLLLAGTYAMRRGTFGPALIDIAPVAAAPGAAPGHYYQAVFN